MKAYSSSRSGVNVTPFIFRLDCYNFCRSDFFVGKFHILVGYC